MIVTGPPLRGEPVHNSWTRGDYRPHATVRGFPVVPVDVQELRGQVEDPELTYEVVERTRRGDWLDPRDGKVVRLG